MEPRTNSAPASDAASGLPLASHAAFLRSLASSLLFDKSAAGDVAQRSIQQVNEMSVKVAVAAGATAFIRLEASRGRARPRRDHRRSRPDRRELG